MKIDVSRYRVKLAETDDELAGAQRLRYRVFVEEMGARLGPVFTEERASRGLAVGDLDDDGRLDVVINDLDGSPQVLRNETTGAGHWLLVKVRGKGKTTDALGAVITVKAGPLVQRRVVLSGTGYLSQDDRRAHFGLGQAGRADSVEVRWPDGTTSRLESVEANRIVEVEPPR